MGIVRGGGAARPYVTEGTDGAAVVRVPTRCLRLPYGVHPGLCPYDGRSLSATVFATRTGVPKKSGYSAPRPEKSTFSPNAFPFQDIIIYWKTIQKIRPV